MDDTLRTCHPAVSFAYFALVIACAMLLMHPVCLLISLLGAVLFILSDSLLSMQKFRKQTKWGNTAVIGTYGTAQACMSIGLTLLLCPPLM